MRCFVCYGETAERCACACKACVHGACLLKTIESLQKTDCSICAQPIRNVQQREVRAPAWWAIAFTFALVSTIATSSLASLLLLALAVDDRDHAAFYDLLVCCASSVCLAMCASGLLSKLLTDHDLVATRRVYCFA